MFEALIIEYSSFEGSKLPTWQLRYPRIIHEEFLTHRAFSRNAASSRAIPVTKMIKMVEENPFIPVYWGKNQKGMQADEELTPHEQELARQAWLQGARDAVRCAQRLTEIGVHKQIANRPLHAWQWMSTVMTSSDMDNFFDLRNHPMAQPEFHHLAKMMAKVLAAHTPRELRHDDYHLPYVLPQEKEEFRRMDLVRMSVARCARVSYLTHDNQVPRPEEDIALHDRLVGSRPLHASPAEHQARPAASKTSILGDLSGNFDKRWYQYRKFLEKDIGGFF